MTFLDIVVVCLLVSAVAVGGRCLIESRSFSRRKGTAEADPEEPHAPMPFYDPAEAGTPLFVTPTSCIGCPSWTEQADMRTPSEDEGLPAEYDDLDTETVYITGTAARTIAGWRALAEQRLRALSSVKDTLTDIELGGLGRKGEVLWFSPTETLVAYIDRMVTEGDLAATPCACNGNPHTEDCRLFHFLSRAGLWGLPSEELLRLSAAHRDGLLSASR